MVHSEAAEDKREEFLDKLASLGYGVDQVSKRPQVYLINGRRVNIRSRSISKGDATGSRLFWYDVSTNILEDVDLVIYLMTKPDYFVMIPSSFLADLVDRMYRAEDIRSKRVFDIDWDDLTLVLQEGERVDIYCFHHNLIHEEDYPEF
jgi:hypothetical protein